MNDNFLESHSFSDQQRFSFQRHCLRSMGGVKRRLDGDASLPDHGVHPARKRRVEYTDEDAQLAKIYNDLADELQSVRLQAASELVKSLSAKSDRQLQRLDLALTRLIKGLCSGRKAARLGFSIALAEVLRLAFRTKSPGITLASVTQSVLALTKVEGNVSGQERRDALFGRRFAFQAILQSNVAQSPDVSLDEWRGFLDSHTELACQRQWLRKECGAVLYEYLVSLDGEALPGLRVQSIADAWGSRSLWKTAEGVALWLKLSGREEVKLPKTVWHHRNPLSSKERPTLSKVMQEVPVDDEASQQNDKPAKSGSRQAAPSFAWSVILTELCNSEHGKSFPNFWHEVVENGLFAPNSSAERKALGFQVVSLAIALTPVEKIEHLLLPGIVRCILNQRASSDRYLFEAAKAPLNGLIARTKLEPSAAAMLIQPLLENGAINFDHLSKSKTVETIAAQASDSSLLDLISFLDHHASKTASVKKQDVHALQRMIADLLLLIVRSRREKSDFFNSPTKGTRPHSPSLKPWLDKLLSLLIGMGYSTPRVKEPITQLQPLESILRSRTMSCLSHLLSFPVSESVMVPLAMISKLRAALPHFPSKAESDAMEALSLADKAIKDVSREAFGAGEINEVAAAQALLLLLAMSVLQVYNEELDALPALNDLLASYQSWSDVSESRAMLVELLLSFVSKPSALFRKLAEQVFAAFASSLTLDSLRSMLDVLEQKESLGGQQELFDQHDEGQAEEDEESDSETRDAIDIDEDDSDVELVNGVAAGASAVDEEDEKEDDESAVSVTSEEDEEGTASDDDEEAVFDRKLAEALGPAALGQDDDEHGSDMDDEQMMALEPHLTSIFKQRKKDKPSTKQEGKEARENMINFKNRVLDLLAIYVKSQYSNPLVLDLILPLVVLVRTTTSKPAAEKAFSTLKQCFDACSKHKSLPQLDDGDALFDLLAAVHAEAALGGSKLHANACSRASLFLTKVLVALDAQNYAKVAEMYSKLQSRWYSDPASKIQGSIFTEWTSWSMTTRKQR